VALASSRRGNNFQFSVFSFQFSVFSFQFSVVSRYAKALRSVRAFRAGFIFQLAFVDPSGVGFQPTTSEDMPAGSRHHDLKGPHAARCG